MRMRFMMPSPERGQVRRLPGSATNTRGMSLRQIIDATIRRLNPDHVAGVTQRSGHVPQQRSTRRVLAEMTWRRIVDEISQEPKGTIFHTPQHGITKIPYLLTAHHRPPYSFL